MTTPPVTLRPWTIMDHVEEQLSEGRHLSFVLGEIAGALVHAGQDPSVIPCGQHPMHFAAGIASTGWKLGHLCGPREAWHPMHTN